MFAVFDDTTPLVEGLSIDEAFLDVARAAADRRHAGRDRRAAAARACASEVGLPITVGVARTKFLAKVASGVAKPDGLLVVPPDGELAFLHPLPVERLWGVGAGDRRASCTSAGIATVGEVARAGRGGAGRRCSAAASGRHLHALAHNRDPRRVRGRPAARLDRVAARARPRSRDARPRRSTPSSSALVDRVTPADAHGAAASGARSCCGCASTTSRARRARTRSPRATAQTHAILATARELLAAAMPMIERQGLTLVGIAVAQPRRRRRRPARAAVRARDAPTRSTPRSTTSASASAPTAITPRRAARPRPGADRAAAARLTMALPSRRTGEEAA